jgi:3-hydroxybutyryl-CoA dehydrogenase
MNFQVVGVVGAGIMGVGVSQNLAQTGHQVILLDVSEEILERAKQQIKNNIRFQGFFKTVRRQAVQTIFCIESSFQLIINS